MQENILKAQKELALREKARRDFKTFLYLKWQRYDKKDFLHNWHFEYLTNVLTHTIPKYCKDKNQSLLTRIMLNMPPSYGKTETLARAFIPYALGVDRSRKFMYVSYSDDLCKRISNEVRDLIKSPFWQSIFKKKPTFLQDNNQEFILKEGGGCFFTTLKSAITGFHAHCILIDDPIKVSEMSSKSAREMVNNNFKASVLSRLKDNQSSIIILMQRLGDEDLCGFLLNPRNVPQSTIEQWKVIKLQALNKKKEIYQIGNFCYEREAGEPLFMGRHNLEQLETLKNEMGEDDFSTQMQQEPQSSETGFFEVDNFTSLPSYEMGECRDYILVDTAESLSVKADDRAITAVGVDMWRDLPRYVLKDCFAGIFDEEVLCEKIIEAMLKYPNAPCYIEGTGGGLIVSRILEKKILETNLKLKAQGKNVLINEIKTYPTIKNISKMQKISAIKPYLNTGHLRYLSTASGVEKIKKQLGSFNPQKPHRKNDCIDTLATAIYLSEITPAYKSENNYKENNKRFLPKRTWRI
ncbi:terminase family protein [Helicobacter sp. 14348-15]|uniref:terminase family protein n=1 Tax=Helicobacter colisuis TaxID=2949739 RepID=UPI00202AFC25|nr:terminase family protein [Helicobacter colisuis]MCL9820600.1 terminase family protein [Helicobacter colisuis]